MTGAVNHIRLFLPAVLLGLVGAGALRAQDWQLVWEDDFDTDGLVDTTRWSYQVGGGGWGNQELQYYTERREQNVRISGGHLIIEARREDFQGSSYTSGRIRTLGKGDWRYGRIEVRAQLPSGVGTWPAIWMLASDSDYGDGGWPDTGEIDVMEAVGHDPGRTHSAVHTDALNHTLGNNPSATVEVATSETAFHEYVLEWTPNRIATFVDGKENLVYNRNGASWEKWPFDRPFHLILNVAVGGTWGGAHGVDESAFPAQLNVDYVRVYRDNHGPPAIGFPSAPDTIFVEPGGELALNAVASDPVSDITRLTVYQSDAAIASAQVSELEVRIAGLHPGCYTIRATADDSDGWTGFSDSVAVRVGDVCGQAPYLMRPHSIPGRIEAEYYDIGGPGVAYTDLSGYNTGGGIRRDENVDIGPSQDVGGGYRLEDVTRREWVEYTAHVEQSGRYRMIGRITALNDGKFDVSINAVELAAPFAYESTNSTSFYRNAVLEGISLEEGPAVIRLAFNNVGTLLNWFEFELISGTRARDAAGRPVDGLSIEGLYPNPVSEYLQIAWSGSPRSALRVSLFDTFGRQISASTYTTEFSADQRIRLNVHDLAPGLYGIRLLSNGQRAYRSFIRIK